MYSFIPMGTTITARIPFLSLKPLSPGVLRLFAAVLSEA